jgi:hypothetical protein
VKNFEDKELGEAGRAMASRKVDVGHAAAPELSDDSVTIKYVLRHWVSFERTIAPGPTISVERESQVTGE